MIVFNEIVTPGAAEVWEDDLIEICLADSCEADLLKSDLRALKRRTTAKTTTREETEMSRMTYDGVLLQSQLAYGETRSIEDIAQKIFSREGEDAGAVALSRAKRAALNLITMGQAKAVPNRKEMTHIQSTASSGTQLGALMNLAVRRAEQGRQDRRTEDRLAETQTVVIADLQGKIHSKI